MRSTPNLPVSIDTLTDLVDVVPVDALLDFDTPDLTVVTDALGDATAVVADSAIVVGRQGRRLVTRSAAAAWRNRELAASVAVVAVLVVAVLAFVKRSGSDADDSELA